MYAPTMTPAAEIALARTFSRAMGAAGRALAEMSGHEIHIIATEVARTSATHVVEAAGGAGTVVVGVYLGITGSIDGHAVLILRPDGAHQLATLLLDGMGPIRVETFDPLLPSFDELEMSALREVGNVTIGAFLNEVGRHLDEPALPTVPVAISDMAGSILDGVIADLAADSDELLAARTYFQTGTQRIEGAVLVLPRNSSLAALTRALGAD